MGKTLYLECASGISGDMVVAALLDLGANEAGLRRALASLGVDGFDVKVTRRPAGALDACDFDVVLDAAHDGHDHDMDYLYGHLDGEGGEAHHHHEHEAHHHHEHEAHHHHEHEAHHHHGHGHHRVHRNLADVTAIIDAGDLAPRAREMAHRIFRIVAEAEAKAHGTTVDEVHFHEVGAVDSIVDVVAAAYCLDDLDVTDVVVSPLAEGEGQVRSAHGVLNVPVPAVANIAAANGLALSQLHRKGEFVTPTGAAIAAAARTLLQLPESYVIKAVGIGCGKRMYDPPSTVRAMIIEPLVAVDAPTAAPVAATVASNAEADFAHPDLWKLECEVDDCPGEALAHALERLYAVGAREAHYLPVYMKKNRPGYQLEVLCDEGLIPVLEQVIFEDTTTIGVRRTPLWRTALARRVGEVQTPYGVVVTKVVTLPGGQERAYPEYDSVSSVAAAAGAAYQDVYRAALSAGAQG